MKLVIGRPKEVFLGIIYFVSLVGIIASVNIVGDLTSPVARHTLLLANVGGVLLLSCLGTLIAYIIDYSKSYGLYRVAKRLNWTLFLIFIGVLIGDFVIRGNPFQTYTSVCILLMAALSSTLNSTRKEMKTDNTEKIEK